MHRVGIIGNGRIAERFIPEAKFVSGVKIIYFPYTKGVSSTVISQALGLMREIN